MPRCTTAILAVLLLVLALPECKATTFTQYELFKNTNFHDCPRTLENVTSRSQYYAIDQYNEVNRANDFCTSLTGNVPIILPARANPSAFTPGWFSLVLQFVGWMFSFASLWRAISKLPPRDVVEGENPSNTGTGRKETIEGLHPPSHTEPKEIPISIFFWIGLPIEVAREIAWWVRFGQAVQNPNGASWISPVAFTSALLYCQYMILSIDPSVSWKRGRKVFLRHFWVRCCAAVALLLSGFGMFIASFAMVIMRVTTHWSIDNYEILPSALADPAALRKDLPQACLTHIASLSSFNRLITDPQTTWWPFIQIGQFVVCLWVMYKMTKFFGDNNGEKLPIRANIVQYSLALGVSLLVPIFFQSLFAAFTGKAYMSGFRNGDSEGEVCELAVVFLDKRLGYVDVEYRRAERVILGFLGV
ncbi:hypothetical protein B0J14DRAFT_598386, partial [Halenospora varia]